MSLQGTLLRWFYEWAARGQSYDKLIQKLEENASVIHERMANAASTDFNRSRAVHVIGIERWGTKRLRVLLGEPLVIDEYDGYAPSDQLSLPELAEEFQRTRAANLALVRQLQRKGVPLTQTVKHNEVGELSAAGWIYYLDNHMWRETVVLVPSAKRKMKQATGA